MRRGIDLCGRELGPKPIKGEAPGEIRRGKSNCGSLGFARDDSSSCGAGVAAGESSRFGSDTNLTCVPTRPNKLGRGHPLDLPASDVELIEVDCCAAVRTHAVDLEVGEQNRGPTERECGRNCFIDLLK
jgi:hypothetical protein